MALPLAALRGLSGLFGLLLLLALAGPAQAEEENEPRGEDAEQVATRVLDALDDGDDEALRALAARDTPDPWQVAEILIEEDESQAASAYARAASGHPAGRALPAYVQARARVRLDERFWDLYEGVEDALDGTDFKRVVARTRSLHAAMPTLRHVELHAMRAEALSARGAHLEAGETYAAAAAGATQLGWRARAAALHAQAAQALLAGDQPSASAEEEESAHEIHLALGDRFAAAVALGRMGAADLVAGNVDLALEAHAAALVLWEALKNETGILRATQSLGVALEQRGDYPAALAQFEDALQRAERLDSAPDRAAAWAGLGRVHEFTGNFARARTYLERCLEHAVSQKDADAEAGACINLASLHSSMGDEHKCLALNQRALALGTQLEDAELRATALGNIGAAYEDLGQIDKALDHYRQALALHEVQLDRSGEAKTNENIGLLLSEDGQAGPARAFLERAVAIAREIGDGALLTSTLESLARGHYEAARYGEASKAAAQARGGLRALLAGLGEGERTATRGEYSDIFVIGAAAAAHREDLAAAVSFLEEGRAMTLAGVLAGRNRSRVSSKLRAAESRALAGVTRARSRLERKQSGRDGDAKAEQRALEEALDALRQVRDRIREASGAAAPAPGPADLGAVQAALAPGQVFVFYLLAGDEVLAVVLGPTTARVQALGKRDPLQIAIQALHGTGGIGTRGRLRRETRASTERKRDLLAPLRKILVEPLAIGEATTQVIVSPAGIVGYVPFGGLLAAPVVVVPSATTWLLLRRKSPVAGKDVLAVGNPDYGGTSEQALPVRMKGEVPAPLPATKVEVETVGDVRLLGAEANEADVRERLGRAGRWRSIHFACHGLLDPRFPRLSALALSRTRAEDDGLLSALEILGMPLSADVAVLSACETGRGKVVDGEGISGLTRAFMYAGVPRVVCSLWKVDDEATRALMVKFYELWGSPTKSATGARPMGVSEALQKAQAHVRSQERWTHPFYWAAWVVWGLP